MQLIKCVFQTKYSKNKSIKNNQRLRSAGDNDRRSKRFCSNAVLCVSFKWQMVKTRVIRLQGVEERNVRDQIALGTFLSLWMLATYMRRMRNYNLEIRIAGSSCRPQLSIQDLSIKLFLNPVTRNCYSVGPSFDVAMPKWTKRRMHPI